MRSFTIYNVKIYCVLERYEDKKLKIEISLLTITKKSLNQYLLSSILLLLLLSVKLIINELFVSK